MEEQDAETAEQQSGPKPQPGFTVRDVHITSCCRAAERCHVIHKFMNAAEA